MIQVAADVGVRQGGKSHMFGIHAVQTANKKADTKKGDPEF